MSEQDLIITREFAAPRELVFRAWADCGHLSRWWGPRDGRTRTTRHRGIPRAVAERNGAPRGWRETFDKLDSCLTELPRGTEAAH